MRKSFVYGRSFFLFSLCAMSAMTAGILFAAATDILPLSLMRLATGPVSIVMLLPFYALPFLIAAGAVSIEQWNILHLTVFLRFFHWGLSAGLCIRSFGSAAWLVQPLCQFTDNGTLILFCLYCFGPLENRRSVFGYYLIGIGLLAMIDYCIVWPFLASLLTF